MAVVDTTDSSFVFQVILLQHSPFTLSNKLILSQSSQWLHDILSYVMLYKKNQWHSYHNSSKYSHSHTRMRSPV